MGSRRRSADAFWSRQPGWALGALDFGGEAVLVGELVEVRGERDRGGRAQERRRVGPRGVEQLVDRAGAGGERVEQGALAREPVLDVLRDLRLRILDERAVARADQRGRALAQALQPGE